MRTLLGALLLAAAAATAAAGDLIPTDPRFGPLRVKLHRVETTIDNQIAVTKITQIFANDHNEQLEAIYVFPTPSEASIIDFSMTIIPSTSPAPPTARPPRRSIRRTPT